MAVKPGKKSIGGNTSIGGAAVTPKTPDNKRKSLPKPAPVSANKKPAPATPLPQKANSPKKASPEKPVQKGISANINRVSEQSKGINKQNKNKKGKGQGPHKQQQNKNQKGPQQQKAGKHGHGGKKNRRQRLQAKLSAKPRSPLSQSRALKAEQELNKTSNRVFLVKLPDHPLNVDEIKSWSPNIESTLFPKPIEPRSFLLVLKPGANLKKEIETLNKIKFGNGKISVEERKSESALEGRAEGVSPADLVDPYTLYLTNLDESVTREDVQELFKKATTVMNPKKHNPRVAATGSGTKFCFVGFESADDALSAFQDCFNKKFVNDKYIVARFRRVGKNELKKEEAAPAAAVAKRKAEEPAKKQDNKKSKLIKEEPKEEVEDEDDEDDEDDDDDVDGEEDDESEDDDDDGLGEDDDDDDEEDDDDDDDE